MAYYAPPQLFLSSAVYAIKSESVMSNNFADAAFLTGIGPDVASVGASNKQARVAMACMVAIT